ncbi:hypothetical protein [Paraliomyxa miuraensis]|uniref:hypothetical protein n=1 Tax=Paraliomyxa miuraensis TaxID=376150 RepID=UPI0022558D3D|nr:hypothetical protein [Paraliomyxa miuraensis]MCX4239507.1 hypothetical protein [Paraliomyxa miuraensis]
MDSPSAYVFLGPTVSVTVAAGNTIHVTSTAVLGTTNITGATMSRLSVCHQPAAGGVLIDNDADWSVVRIPVNTSIPMAVSQRISGLAAGTYNVGMCYRMAAGQSGNWNDNDWVTSKVLVLL